ncbi:intracellular sulfur oxidation DsrE/DsrF family protein [Bradyrhizobium sp. i1.4.4]
MASVQYRCFFKTGQSRAAAPGIKVVYHLSDADKASFVLSNIANHLHAIDRPEDADIRLVVHGPALLTFLTKVIDVGFDERLGQLRDQGVKLEACGNTMRGAQLSLTDLAGGFVVVEKGGVYRLAELQQAGFAYIRP